MVNHIVEAVVTAGAIVIAIIALLAFGAYCEQKKRFERDDE